MVQAALVTGMRDAGIKSGRTPVLWVFRLVLRLCSRPPRRREQLDARGLGARDRWLLGKRGQSGPCKHPEVTNAVSSSLFGHFPLLANKSSVEPQT